MNERERHKYARGLDDEITTAIKSGGRRGWMHTHEGVLSNGEYGQAFGWGTH